MRGRGPEIGDGPYRSATILVERRRRMPPLAGVASAVGIAWGILTLFVFAPLGVLLCLVTVPEAPHGLLAALAGAGALVSTLSGFAIGIRLMSVGKSLVVRSGDSVARVGSVATHTAWHHALVLATVAAMHGAFDEARVLVYAAFPCAVGVGVAALLALAGRVLRRLDREDTATAAI